MLTKSLLHFKLWELPNLKGHELPTTTNLGT